MKIICQNCVTIMGDKPTKELSNGIALEVKNGVDVMVQTIGEITLLTLKCPKCGCLLQIQETQDLS